MKSIDNIVLAIVGTWFFLFCIPFVSFAQEVRINNGFYASAGIGYANNLSQKESNGVATNVGLGYRLSYRHFLFDVGVGGQYMYTDDKLDDITVTLPGTDEEGVDYMGCHTWNHRIDRVQCAQISVPVVVGGEWNKFNFLLGAKMTVPVWTHSQVGGLYSLEGVYTRYIEPFENMPRHGYVQDQAYKDPVRQGDKSFDLRVVANVNYRVAKWQYYRRSNVCYVGIFAEYSVWHQQNRTPFVVGAKVTFLGWLKEKDPCHCIPD